MPNPPDSPLWGVSPLPSAQVHVSRHVFQWAGSELLESTSPRPPVATGEVLAETHSLAEIHCHVPTPLHSVTTTRLYANTVYQQVSGDQFSLPPHVVSLGRFDTVNAYAVAVAYLHEQ